MDAFTDTGTAADAGETATPDGESDAQALWLALAADHRARDERTARLRAMRLVGGDDAPG